MYFADFTNLKIITDYNYITKAITVPVHNVMPVIEIEKIVKEELQKLELKQTTLPILYDFTLAATGLDHLEVDEVVDYLTSFASIIVPTVLRFLETGKGYKRERRLDVPDKLKPLHSSYSCVKRACNNEILTPVLNIKVNFSGICFLMCMGRDIDKPDDADEWLHSTEGEENE